MPFGDEAQVGEEVYQKRVKTCSCGNHGRIVSLGHLCLERKNLCTAARAISLPYTHSRSHPISPLSSFSSLSLSLSLSSSFYIPRHTQRQTFDDCIHHLFTPVKATQLKARYPLCLHLLYRSLTITTSILQQTQQQQQRHTYYIL